MKEIEKNVNHPIHYGGENNPFECIKVLRAWLSKEEYEGFLKGNAIKYLCRIGKKDNALQEAEKAKWYIDELIHSLDKNEKVVEDNKSDKEINEPIIKDDIDLRVNAIVGKVYKTEDGDMVQCVLGLGSVNDCKKCYFCGFNCDGTCIPENRPQGNDVYFKKVEKT